MGETLEAEEVATWASSFVSRLRVSRGVHHPSISACVRAPVNCTSENDLNERQRTERTEAVADLLAAEAECVLDLGLERRPNGLVAFDAELVALVTLLGRDAKGAFGKEEGESGDEVVGSVAAKEE